MARGVHLFARDVEILELLAERRVETLTALHERLWPDSSRKTAYNRLGALARAGYLEHVLRGDQHAAAGKQRPSQHLYLLGPKAHTALRIRDRRAHTAARRNLTRRIANAEIDHQLATNRVGDWLGTRLMTATDAAAGLDRQFRPDAAYRAQPDPGGRDLVLVEVDLGHYSRARILAKVQGFLAHPDARSILFATPTDERANLIARWVRERYGIDAMARLQAFSFAELRRGAHLATGTEPDPAAISTGPPDWYAAVMGPPGCD